MSFARVAAVAALAIWSQAAFATAAAASETTAAHDEARTHLSDGLRRGDQPPRRPRARRDDVRLDRRHPGRVAARRERGHDALRRAGRDRPQTARTLRGVIAREARYISIDPYANAFSIDYTVVEEKFEVDSLLYPIWLAERYWRDDRRPQRVHAGGEPRVRAGARRCCATSSTTRAAHTIATRSCSTDAAARSATPA